MTRLQWVSIGIVLSALVGGCGLFGGKDETEVVVQPVPIASPGAAATQSTTSAIGSLTQPTNPDERLRGLKSGRIDPFAALLPGLQSSSGGGSGGAAPGASSPETSGEGSTGNVPAGEASSSETPVIVVPPASRPQSRVAVVPPAASSRSSPRSATRTATGSSTSKNSASNRSSSSSASADSSSSGSRSGSSVGSGSRTASSNSSQRNALPDLSSSGVTLSPLPQAELAKGVQVTGFAIVAGVPRAIVKAPDERTSRSVTAGDRLSNGQVLVKRIDFTNPEEPVLILEQSGTRVAVAVGQPGTQLAAASEAPPFVPALW